MEKFIVSLAESKKKRLTNTNANFVCVFKTCLALPLIGCYVRALGMRSVREREWTPGLEEE